MLNVKTYLPNRTAKNELLSVREDDQSVTGHGTVLQLPIIKLQNTNQPAPPAKSSGHLCCLHPSFTTSTPRPVSLGMYRGQKYVQMSGWWNEFGWFAGRVDVGIAQKVPKGPHDLHNSMGHKQTDFASHKPQPLVMTGSIAYWGICDAFHHA